MAKLFDRVGQATATTGTGTVTLGAVITDSTNGDFATFTDMGAIATDVVNYLIVDGNNWELGTGTLGGTGPGFTMTRTVSKSKISGTAGTTLLSLSGSAKVYSMPSLNTNSWEFVNVTNPQSVYVYGSGSGVNYSRMAIKHLGGTLGGLIATEAGGTGSAGDIEIAPNYSGSAGSTRGTSIYNLGHSGDGNYERAIFQWYNNDLYIGTQNGGSGTVRSVNILYGNYTLALDASGGGFRFHNGGIGFGSPSSGVAEVNNGSLGTYRDLKLRSGAFTGGVSKPITIQTAAYTILNTDHNVVCNATTAGFTVTLPTAAGNAGLIINVCKTDSSANVITVAAAGGAINNNTTITAQYQSRSYQSDGTNWYKYI